MSEAAPALSLVGHLDTWSARPGERVRVFLCDHEELPGQIDLVRLVAHGAAPVQQLEEHPVEALAPIAYQGRAQQIHPGSWAEVPVAPFFDALESVSLEIVAYPTSPGGREQALLGTWCAATQRGFALFLDELGTPTVRVGAGPGRVAELATGRSLRPAAWVRIRASYDAASGTLEIAQEPLETRAPGFDYAHRGAHAEARVATGSLAASELPLLFAAWHDRTGAAPRRAHFDGRLEAPRLAARADAEVFDCGWDFARDIESDRITDVGRHGLHGRVHNAPLRAVTGSRWDGGEHDWRNAPDRWAAIHFHSDDVAYSGFEMDAELALPEDLGSGIYAVRATSEDGRTERLPLFVRPRRGDEAPLLFLIPTATYLAYANHQLHEMLGGALFGGGDRPFQRYLAEHPEVGPDTYGFHADGTGVAHTSRLRPVLNLRPDADGWAFSADLALTGFLERHGIPYSVATDEDLDAEGETLLERHRLVVTGSHPEYWSTPMLDALEAWQREGGRLAYLGGNGFYWRVAFSPYFPGVMEVRRADHGTKAWAAPPGEYHHAFTGELGGLWRNIGRPPNAIAGVGFTAQGAGGAPYHRTAASRDPRAAWIFEDVKSEDAFGEHGRLGFAADEEIDRFDPGLGSPPHALVLASSGPHPPTMLRVIEEFLVTLPPLPSPAVRSDLVFYETPGGGAVFSTGSIGWIAALAHEGYANDVARITANVLRRFAEPRPFELPDPTPEARASEPSIYRPDPAALALLLGTGGKGEGEEPGSGS